MNDREEIGELLLGYLCFWLLFVVPNVLFPPLSQQVIFNNFQVEKYTVYMCIQHAYCKCMKCELRSITLRKVSKS